MLIPILAKAAEMEASPIVVMYSVGFYSRKSILSQFWLPGDYKTPSTPQFDPEWCKVRFIFRISTSFRLILPSWKSSVVLCSRKPHKSILASSRQKNTLNSIHTCNHLGTSFHRTSTALKPLTVSQRCDPACRCFFLTCSSRPCSLR